MALLEVDDLTALWGAVIADVSIESPQHRAFLSLTKPLGLIQNESGSNLLLSAPNAFAKDVLETRLRAILNEALSLKLDQKINIAVTIDETLQESVVEEAPVAETPAEVVEEAPATEAPAAEVAAEAAAE